MSWLYLPAEYNDCTFSFIVCLVVGAMKLECVNSGKRSPDYDRASRVVSWQ